MLPATTQASAIVHSWLARRAEGATESVRVRASSRRQARDGAARQVSQLVLVAGPCAILIGHHMKERTTHVTLLMARRMTVLHMKSNTCSLIQQPWSLHRCLPQCDASMVDSWRLPG